MPSFSYRVAAALSLAACYVVGGVVAERQERRETCLFLVGLASVFFPVGCGGKRR